VDDLLRAVERPLLPSEKGIPHHQIYRPRERYVNCLVNGGIANAVIDGVIAIQYSGNLSPGTQPSSVAFYEQ
jgi:hypothetical protein